MSKYTTEVRFICESYAGFNASQGYGKVNDILRDSWEKVFDFDFPIFDEAYRSVLCQKILRHYYTREIGFETVGLWKLKLETKLNEIMPYYNDLYKTTTYNFNPLYDVDYTTEHEGEDKSVGAGTDKHTGTIADNGSTNTETSNTTSREGETDTTTQETNQNTRRDLYSDTPQGSLVNLENETYLTDARKITDNGSRNISENKDYSEDITESGEMDSTSQNTRTFNDTMTKNNTLNTTNEYVRRVSGKIGGKTYSAMIQEYRDAIINIDMLIIDDLRKLFMLVW